MKQFSYGKVFTGSKEEYQQKMNEWLNTKTKKGGKRKSFNGFGAVHGYLWINGEPWGPSYGTKKPKKILDTFERKRREYEQTYGPLEVPYPTKDGYEAHHKRILKIYDPFFKGLSDKEKRKLSKWFIDQGFGLGNIDDNFVMIKKEFHNKHLHKWLRENRIEVNFGDPGWTNFERDPETGEALDYQYDKQGNVVTRFPNFENLPTMESRIPAVKLYLEQVQPAIDELNDKYEVLSREGRDPDLPDNVGTDDPTLPPANLPSLLIGRGERIANLSTQLGRSGEYLSRGDLDQAFTTAIPAIADAVSPAMPASSVVMNAASQGLGWLNDQGISVFDVIPESINRGRKENLARLAQSRMNLQRIATDKEIDNRLNQAYAEKEYTKFYNAGGGDAKLRTPGWTKEMVVRQGRKNIYRLDVQKESQLLDQGYYAEE